MELRILEPRVRVLSLARGGLWLYTHPLLKMLLLPQRSRCKFFSFIETPEDYTVMLDEEGFKELPPSEFLQVVDSPWLVLNVSSSGSSSATLQPIGVTKIAKSVIAPLAEHNVSVLMLSTYQTDFILVREKDLPVVIHTLAREFDIYKEVNGEPIPANCEDVSNGFLKPKPMSTTVHPVQSPPNRFCILSIAPETLPAIATILLDVLFYSPGPLKETTPSGQDLEPITFFAFSLIEGYISIVMDAETKKRFPSDLLLTSSSGELWRMVRIGGQPLGFDECGIVAQIAEPLADADISAYYISTFNFDHALVTRMDLLDLRSFCESTPVAWFPSQTITKKPGSLMVQDLYRTFTNVEGSLIVLKELQHSYNPEDSLYHKLDKSSILVAGLLSNIRCAICLQSRTPTTFTPRKRTLVVSDFYRKTAGCRVLWNYSKFVAHLARVFRKEFDPGKKPGRPKKRSRLGHTASFSLTHQN